jgi:hypothetical protein
MDKPGTGGKPVGAVAEVQAVMTLFSAQAIPL